MLLAGRHDVRGRHAGRRGQPDRRRRAGGRRHRRLQRVRRLRSDGLRASQPADGRGRSGHDDGGSEPVAAAQDREHGVAERHPGGQRAPAGARPALGSRHGVCAAAGRRRRHADRPRPAAPAGRPGDGRRAQGAGPRGDPAQQPARPGRRRDHRHLARRDGRQPARAPTTAPGTPSTRPPASPIRRTSWPRATSGA